MWLFILAYLGGVLTIASPCVLPVLPFVFSRADQPFTRSGLPLLAGMAAMFVAVATLSAVGGDWVVVANQYGRWVAMALLVLFGLALLAPALGTRLSRPFVRAGDRLSQRVQRPDGTVGPGGSFLLGIATGLLWTPCAGPILGLILTGAALKGASVGTSLLLLGYACGAATSLALALLLGGRVFALMKRSLGLAEWIRRGLGVAMLAGVGVIAAGWDSSVLAQISLASATDVEQSLVDQLRDHPQARGATEALPAEGAMPPLTGVVQWLNSPPLTAAELRGKVVLIDFWTYSCINCLRTLPYLEAWDEKYRDAGLVIIGVHSPEFAFERDVGNVSQAVRRLGIRYPVAIDNRYAVWKAFSNQYWPADYFVDARGIIRHHQFGEGDYEGSEQIIRQLLRESGATNVPTGFVDVHGTGALQAPDMQEIRSPETYIGFERASGFSSGAPVHDAPQAYSVSPSLPLNGWGLSGTWNIGAQSAVLASPQGSIVYHFQARDLHLVLGPGPDGKPIRFKVLLDGKEPQGDHGSDVAPDGSGTVTTYRLYQLIRQQGQVRSHTFSIEFLDAGVAAYAFTFG